MLLAHLSNLSLFNIDDHFIETQMSIDNHYLDLLRVIVDIFLELQQHHIVRLYNSGQRSVRHLPTKTILFFGQ